MSTVSRLNKVLGNTSKYLCNQMVEKSQRSMYQESRKPKKYETVEITTLEKIFKNQKIEVVFEGDKEDLSDLRLKVYVNNAMKFVSQAGEFVITTVRVPRIVRKGWFFTTEFHEKSHLKFKRQKEYERFCKFASVLRDCFRVHEMYREQCYNYVKELEKRNKAVSVSKPL